MLAIFILLNLSLHDVGVEDDGDGEEEEEEDVGLDTAAAARHLPTMSLASSGRRSSATDNR